MAKFIAVVAKIIALKISFAKTSLSASAAITAAALSAEPAFSWAVIAAKSAPEARKAPLPLGVEGVEYEGGLPRTGNARYDDELSTGYFQCEVLKIVDSGALDAYVLFHGLFLPNCCRGVRLRRLEA